MYLAWGTGNGFRKVKAFRIFLGKRMVNEYWIVCVFWRVIMYLGYNMIIG